MNFLNELSRTLGEQNIKTRRLVKNQTIHVSKVGDRSLTPVQKRNLKKEKGFRCDICHKKFDPRYLEVHHRRAISKHKNSLGYTKYLPIYSTGKRTKQAYDRKSNLQVACLKCHDKTKKKRNVTKPLWQQY